MLYDNGLTYGQSGLKKQLRCLKTKEGIGIGMTSTPILSNTTNRCQEEVPYGEFELDHKVAVVAL